jgi:hypothetical protein
VVLLLGGCSASGGVAPIETGDAGLPPSDATPADATPSDATSPEAGRPDAGAERDAGAGGDAGSAPEVDRPVVVNLLPATTDFARLEPWIEGITHARVWGGTRGMTTYPALEAVPEWLRASPSRYWVVTDAEIEACLALQRRTGIRFIYMVNVNDSLESQRAFIGRLLAAGLDVAMLELGNELYLNKFAIGDTTARGVTRAWSAAQYVDEVIDVWAPDLAGFGLPLYVIGAAHGGYGPAEDGRRVAWNTTLRAALAARPGRVTGVTLHRYAGTGRTIADEEDPSAGGFEFVSTFADYPIAVTESGYYFDELTDDNLERAASFWAGFSAALKPGDMFGVHVVYQRSGVGPSSFALALFNEHGRTPTGERFARWLRTGE